MAEGGASQGFDSPKLNPRGARDTDSLFHMSDASALAARENDEQFRRVKDDFLQVARQHRRRELSRSESSGSPSPIRPRSSRRTKNLQKSKFAPFYANDVELWFNQLETQFDLHDITDDDELYRLVQPYQKKSHWTLEIFCYSHSLVTNTSGLREC